MSSISSVIANYAHEQLSSSDTWVIQHNLNTNAPIVDCYVDVAGTLTKIIPASVVVTDTKTVTITFSEPRVGYAYVT